ncbi:alpha/beta fold hydrolase [Gryllotalpicola sp.]|uniref:alpha/beta fold hydrolase n=1 Tax=Gryllotalpicola sp. TaxID=1932787 RepID=UPI002635642B|nr:alpha/beta fold hydrolase [Gryllotalpicola sp.]
MSLAETRAYAEGLDAQIAEVDWAAPDPAAAPFRFEAPSGSLAGWSLGDPANPRVVLVPGATGSKEDFVLLAPPLAEAGYFVQTFDLAGQYESADAGPSLATGRYDFDMHVADVLAFLAAGDAAHVLGYSYGGIVAQQIVATRPDLVRSLTLLTTPPAVGNTFRRVKVVGFLAPFLTAHQAGGLMRWGITTNKNKVDRARFDFVVNRLRVTRRQSVDDMMVTMLDAPDLRAAVADSGIPALVATGEHDLWRVALHAEYADQIGAELAVYRTGHSPCERTPNQLAFDMLRLFERAAAAESAQRDK